MILVLSLSHQSRPGPGRVQQEMVPAAPEPESAPVTPQESAYRTGDAANQRHLAKRAERRAGAGTIAHDAPADNVCAECGSPFGESAPVSITRPSATPFALASYSARNQERILDACPHASVVRTFHGWLAAGRVVMKGQKGIRIVAPDEVDGGRVTRIKHLHENGLPGAFRAALAIIAEPRCLANIVGVAVLAPVHARRLHCAAPSSRRRITADT
jgi:hypothetical protein